MNVPAAAAHRLLARLNLPLALLLALLQRTPLLRVLAGGGEYAVRSPVGQLLRHALTAAALGALHSRAGATSFVVNRDNPIAGTVGQPLAPAVSFTYTGTPSSPASFQITGGSLPPGVSFIPAPVGGTIRSGTPLITGTPTQAGTFTVSVQGFNADPDVATTTAVFQPWWFDLAGLGLFVFGLWIVYRLAPAASPWAVAPVPNPPLLPLPALAPPVLEPPSLSGISNRLIAGLSRMSLSTSASLTRTSKRLGAARPRFAPAPAVW